MVSSRPNWNSQLGKIFSDLNNKNMLHTEIYPSELSNHYGQSFTLHL